MTKQQLTKLSLSDLHSLKQMVQVRHLQWLKLDVRRRCWKI